MTLASQPAMSISIETANPALITVLRIVCQAFFYGCFTVLFAVSIYLMFHAPRRGTGVNLPILIITGLLYLSCSTHFALNIIYCSQFLVPTGTNGFAFLKTNIQNDIDLLILVTGFNGELILIYRCWLLWSRKYWVIILPSLGWLASIVCMSIYFYLPVPYFGVPFSDFPSLVAAFSLPLGTNVIVTTLIAGRIWYLSPSDAQFPTQIGRAAIIIVVESCMLNLAAQIILAILYALGHPARFVVGIIVVQIYGISATLIIIRANLSASNTIQSGPIRNGPPSLVVQPTSSTQARIESISFTEPACRLPAEMPASEVNLNAGF